MLPKSTRRVDENGQGLPNFTNPQVLANNSQGKRMHLWYQDGDKRRCRKLACSPHSSDPFAQANSSHRQPAISKRVAYFSRRSRRIPARKIADQRGGGGPY